MDLGTLVSTIKNTTSALGVQIKGSDNINAAKATGRTILTAKNISKINSLQGKARESIAQYPILFSENLNPKLAPIIANGLEVDYASLVLLVISNTSAFDSGSASSVIRQFHNLNGGLREDVFLAGVENVHSLYEANKALLQPYEEAFNMKTVNESYYNKSMFEHLTEASKDLNKLSDNELKDEISRRAEKRNAAKFSADKKSSMQRDAIAKAKEERDKKKASMDAITSGMGTAKNAMDIATNVVNTIDKHKAASRDAKDWEDERARRNYDAGRANVNTTVKDLVKLNDLHPLILNIDVNFREPQSNTVVTKKLSIGVKCVGHLLKSDDIQYYLTKAAYKNNGLLRVIKWTTGEIKFWKDLVFTLDDIKLSALQNSKAAHNSWFARLEYLAKTSKQSILTGVKSNDTPAAITTLVITKTDVENIKYKDGINILSNPEYLDKIYNTYYLMNLLIVDESLDIVYRYNPFSKTIDREPFSSFEKASKERTLNANDLLKLAK